MTALFQFVMQSGPNTGKTFRLEAPEIIIGREAGNSIAINDAEISRKHAKLNLHGTAYVIQDLGSTNGTFVNGQRLTGSQVLNPGDTVSFGENIVLIYENAMDPNATVIASAQAPKTVAPMQKPVVPATRPPAPQVQGYSGQVPEGPAQMAEPPEKKKFPIGLIIGIILVGSICACIVSFAIIDRLSLWCQVVPFLVPILGGACV
jgi:predicted component of type VI protein secretion system